MGSMETVHQIEPAEVSASIIGAVADHRGMDPMEVDTSLQDYIDVDAIEQLMSHDSTSWTLSFELPQTTVTVTGEGDIRLGEKPEAPVIG